MINQSTHPIPSTEIDYMRSNPERTIDSYTRDIDFELAIRECLIAIAFFDDDDDLLSDIDISTDRIYDLRRCLIAIRALDRESLTKMLLDHSLCPLHHIDYAICFDDDPADCRSIRLIHPDHDT